MLDPHQLKYFADFIEKEIGIVYMPSNYFQLEQRLEKIATYLGLPDKKSIHTKAVTEGINGHFKQFLLDTATNNETSFFRDPKVFNAIENQLLPSLRKDSPNNFIYRIWCMASSFGQEPYSLAMLVHEFLQRNPGHPRFEIIASDIADHALKRCQEAKYTQLEVQRGLSSARLVKYFTKTEDDHWELKNEIKSMVQFKKQNLLDPFVGMGTFNLILCRYVLIYQDASRRKTIFEKIENTLAPNGTLVLGASESAMGIIKDLKQIPHEGAIFYQKP